MGPGADWLWNPRRETRNRRVRQQRRAVPAAGGKNAIRGFYAFEAGVELIVFQDLVFQILSDSFTTAMHLLVSSL